MSSTFLSEEISAPVDLSSLIGTTEPDRWTFEGGRLRLSTKQLIGYPRSPRRYRRSSKKDPRRSKWFKSLSEAGESSQAGPSQPVIPEEDSSEEEAETAPIDSGSEGGEPAVPQGGAEVPGDQGSQHDASYSIFPDISAGVLEVVQAHRGNLRVDEVDAPLGDSSVGAALSNTALVEAVRSEGHQGGHAPSSPHSVEGMYLLDFCLYRDVLGRYADQPSILAGAPTEVVSVCQTSARAGMFLEID